MTLRDVDVLSGSEDHFYSFLSFRILAGLSPSYSLLSTLTEAITDSTEKKEQDLK